MNRIIMAIVLATTMGFASVSFGAITSDDVDLRGLSETEKANIVAAAEKARAAKVAVPSITPAAAQEWAMFGEQIGKGLAATAKELGIAANEILNTPVGMLTAGLIIWHIAGEDLVGVIFGATWLMFFVPIWIWMYRRFIFKTTITHYEKGEGPGGAKKVVTKDRIKCMTDGEGWTAGLYFIVLIAGTIIPLAAIFGG